MEFTGHQYAYWKPLMGNAEGGGNIRSICHILFTSP